MIPEENVDKLEKMIKKVNKKALKLNVAPFTLSKTGEIKEEIFERKVVDSDGNARKKRYLERKIEYTLVGEEIKINGWRFIASVDHQNYPSYNVILNLSDVDLTHYRSADPICEHCGHKRSRKNTYVVYNDNEDKTLQVGSTCVRDFTGHGDAEKILNLFKYVMYEMCNFEKVNEIRCDPRIDTLDYVRIVAELILKDGFVSRQSHDESTADHAQWIYNDIKHFSKFMKNELTDDGEKILKYVMNNYLNSLKEKPFLNDFEENIKNFLSDSSFQFRYVGFVAVAVNSAIKQLQYETERKNRTKNCPNEYVGEVGERLEMTVKVLSKKGFFSDFGYSRRYSLQTPEGNRLTWFTSGTKEFDEGDEIKMKFRVKKFNEYKGMKSTIITRPTILQ